MENRPPYEVLGLTGEDTADFVPQEPIPFEMPRTKIVSKPGQIDLYKAPEIAY